MQVFALEPQPSAPLSSEKRYSSEAVQYILQRAMTRQSDDGFTVMQLQEMAAELNIAPALLQQAALEWQLQQMQPDVAPLPAKRQRWIDNDLARAVFYGVGGLVIFYALSVAGLGDYVLLALLVTGACYFFIHLRKFWKFLKRTTFYASCRSLILKQ